MTEDFVTGLKIIREMSKEEIIDELMEAQRVAMIKRELGDLKAELISYRLAVVRKRMIEEAGMEEHQGAWGSHLSDKKDD